MSKEKIITISLIIIFSAAIIFIGSRVVVSAMESNWQSISSANNDALNQQYAQEIESQTNVNSLMDMGYKLLNGNQVEAAILNFQRVTVLEKSYRDGWLYLGIAELKNNQPDVALPNLQTAEKLDPINIQTYEYLIIAYEQTGDKEAAQKALEKYNYLTNNNK